MSRKFAQYMEDYVTALNEAVPMIANQWMVREKARQKRSTDYDPDDYEYQRTKHLTQTVLPQVHRLEQALVIFAMIEHQFKEAALDFKKITESNHTFHKLERKSVAESFFYYFEAVLGLECTAFDKAIRSDLLLCNQIRNHLVHEGLDATNLSERMRKKMKQFGGIEIKESFIILESASIERAVQVLTEVDNIMLGLEAEHTDFTQIGLSDA